MRVRTTCSGAGAELAERIQDDLEAALRLFVRIVRIAADRSGSAHVHVAPVAHGTRVADRFGEGGDCWDGGAGHVPRSRDVDALREIDSWGAGTAAAGVARADGIGATHGPTDREVPWASVTKILTGVALLVALEEGTVDLDAPAGPPGATLRHLLAHASGLPVYGPDPIAEPGRRRIYSNTGIELAAKLLEERAEMPFADYFLGAVVRPLGLAGRLRGSPAHGYRGPLGDLLTLGRELLAPTVVAAETLAEATTSSSRASRASSRASVGWSRTIGGWRSNYATRSRRTGPASATQSAPSVISGRAEPSSGSIPMRVSRAVFSRIDRSATGQRTPGPRSATPS